MQLALSLKKNAWLFSSAKNIQFQTDIATLVKDDKGKIRAFNDFKKDVLQKHKDYNVTYLQAEYQTALASSQAAKKWQDIQRRKDRYPNLEYKTVGDDHVREAHQVLSGIIRPVDHDFWKSYYPPNGWRCRCYVSQTNKPTNGDDVPKVDKKNVPDMFKDNLALLGNVLPASHPYFENLRKSDQVGITDEVIKAIPYMEVKTYDNGGKISIHPFADKGVNNKHLKENYKGALYMAETFGDDVKIRYHLTSSVKNPEYLINGKIGDLKKPVNQPNKVIKKAIEQDCKIIVFNTENYKSTKNNLINQVRGNFNNRIKNKETLNIESIYIISNGTVERIKYQDLMKKKRAV